MTHDTRQRVQVGVCAVLTRSEIAFPKQELEKERVTRCGWRLAAPEGICTGVADREEGKKMHHPTTGLTDICWQQPSEGRLLDLLVYHIHVRVCSKPIVLPEHPFPPAFVLSPISTQFQMRGVLLCLQGKVTRTFLLCEKQCIFN